VTGGVRLTAGRWAGRLAAISFAIVIVISPLAARFDLEARPIPQIAPAYTDLLFPWAYVAMVVTLGLWAASVALRPRPLRLGPAFIWIPAVGLLAIAALSAVVSIDPTLAAFNVAKLAVTIAIGWYVVNEVDGLERLIVPVLVMVGSQGLIAIIQGATQHAIGLTFLQELRIAPGTPNVSVVATTDGASWLRAYGLTAHPNILGGILAFGLLIIAAAQGVRRSTRLIRMAVFGLGVAGLFLTFSRAAWIAFGVGLIVAIAMLAIRRDGPGTRAWGAAALTAAVIGVALAIPFTPYLAARANVSGPVANESRSIDERLALAGLGLQVFTGRPLLGTGLGTVPQAMRATDPTFEFAYQPAHVVLIDAAAEIGIVGGACYLALVVAPWLALAAARRRWTRQLAGASAAVAAVTVVGLFDFYTWTASAGRTWAWILLGLWVVAYRAGTAVQARDVLEPDLRPDG
jgi:O-antigen ligase